MQRSIDGGPKWEAAPGMFRGFAIVSGHNNGRGGLTAARQGDVMKNNNIALVRLRFLPFLVAALTGAAFLQADPGDPLGDAMAIGPGAAAADIDLAPDGRSVVVYQGDAAGTGGIVARIVDDGGVPQGDPILVSETTAISHTHPAVAVSKYGYFMAAWVADGPDGGGHGISGRLFGYGGSPITGEFQVNTTTVGDQGHSAGYGPAVATSLYGATYVVVWSSVESGGYGVYGQRYDSAGVPLGAEFRVNTVPASAHATVAVAMDYWGQFVVVWDGVTLGSTVSDIVARRYDSQGEPLGPEFRVNDPSVYPMSSPAVAMDAVGNFVATWQGAATAADNEEIHARRFDAATGALGAQFQVNATVGGRQAVPRIGADADGDFVVLWESEGQDGSDLGVYGQRFSAGGAALGGEFRVNAATAGAQRLGGVAIDADGDFTALWEGPADTTTGVFAQRYRGPMPIDLAVDLQDLSDPVTPGSALAYEIFVENRNASDPESGEGVGYASGLTVTVNLPAGAEVLSTSGEWRCSSAGPSSLTCVRGWAMPPQSTTFLRIDAVAPATSGDVVADATVTADQDDPALADNTDTELTTLGDVTPDPFTFIDVIDVPRGTLQTSNQVMVTGLALPAPIRVTGGSYSVNGGTFTSDAGSVVDGDVVRVQHTASPDFAGWVYTTLEIGDVSETFSSTTQARDIAPDPFVFVDAGDVARNTAVVSAPVTVAGINDGAPISVEGGAYSINGGSFVTWAGTVWAGASVRVSHTSAATFGTPVGTVLTIGGVSDTFTSTTLAQDLTPDPFTFADRADVPRNTPIFSNLVTVTGINDAAPISVSGGTYSINGGGFTAAPGTVSAGWTVQVRQFSSDEFATAVDTVLTIGGVSDTFTSTTVARDTTPDAYVFTDVSGVGRGAAITSSEITVRGINDWTPISVAGGEYSIDGMVFTAASGLVANGSRVRVRHTSASGFSAAVDTTLTIGGVADVFTSTTEAEDTSPDAFAFTDQTGVATGTTVTSAAITVAGVNSTAAVSVAGGAYSINGGPYTTAAGTAQAGDQIRTQHVSASSANASVNTTLNVGGVSDVFTSTTGAVDTTPDPFSFVDVTGARRGARVTSNVITVAGINAPVSITVAGASAEYSKNGGAYTSNPGTVGPGDSLRVRATTASTYATTVHVTVTIGGVSDLWSLTTAAK